jgi:hypothetical protein
MKLSNLLRSIFILGGAKGAILSVQSPAESQYTTVTNLVLFTHCPAHNFQIQQALDAAKPGDTILVYPGTYPEKLTVSIDSITLQGSSYPSTKPAENTVSISYSTSSSNTVDDDSSGFSPVPYFEIPLLIKCLNSNSASDGI